MQNSLSAQLLDMLQVLLTAICAKVAKYSASQKLQSCVKFEIIWNCSVKNLAFVSMPTMAYRFSVRNLGTEIARIRHIVSFRQVRPEKMYEYFITASTLPELCVLISFRNMWQQRGYLSLGQLTTANLLHKAVVVSWMCRRSIGTFGLGYENRTSFVLLSI
jgi:hypothetical protein